jgi:hypothetical protein
MNYYLGLSVPDIDLKVRQSVYYHDHTIKHAIKNLKKGGVELFWYQINKCGIYTGKVLTSKELIRIHKLNQL